MVVHGDAPIAPRPAPRWARPLGYDMVDVVGRRRLDDAAAVVVASHGRDEEEVLDAALRAGVPYVGLVASRKRGEAVVAALDRARDAGPACARRPGSTSAPARPRRSRCRSWPRSSPPAPAPVRAAGRRRAGRGRRAATAIDPVCGMTVATVEASLHLDHDGARYWFCGSGCLRAFAADPGAYVRT